MRPVAYARGVVRPARRLLAALAVAVLSGVGAGAGAGCESAGPAKVEVVPGAPAGDVTAVAGEVTATRDGMARPLAVGDVVSGDDVVATGAGASVTIALRHNGAVWNLGAAQSRRVGDAAAWSAPRRSGPSVAAGERTAAAGRHAEREAADTAASAVAPGATAAGGGEEAAVPRAVIGETGGGGGEGDPAGGTGTSAGSDDALPDDPTRSDREASRPKAEKDRRTPRTDKRPAEDPPPDKVPEKANDAGGCDEVGCALDPSQACCAKMKAKKGGGSHGKPLQEPKGGGALPEQPARGDLKAAMDRVLSKVRRCFDTAGASGTVRVKLTVTPDGKVGAVDVTEAPSEALGACVANEARRATFPKSQRGVTFVYPFKL